MRFRACPRGDSDCRGVGHRPGQVAFAFQLCIHKLPLHRSSHPPSNCSAAIQQTECLRGSVPKQTSEIAYDVVPPIAAFLLIFIIRSHRSIIESIAKQICNRPQMIHIFLAPRHQFNSWDTYRSCSCHFRTANTCYINHSPRSFDIYNLPLTYIHSSVRYIAFVMRSLVCHSFTHSHYALT